MNLRVKPVKAALLIPHWTMTRSMSLVNAMTSMSTIGSGFGLKKLKSLGRYNCLHEVCLFHFVLRCKPSTISEQIMVARISHQIEPVPGTGSDPVIQYDPAKGEPELVLMREEKADEFVRPLDVLIPFL